MIQNILFKYFNAVITVIYGYAIYYDYRLTESYRFYPVPDLYWSKFVWLTMINLYLHLFYNFVAALFSLCNVRNQSLLKPFHFVATSLLFPAGFTVVLLFWGLVYLDPNFLMDENAKIILAVKWFNHAIHTLPLAAMLLDFAIWKHARPAKRSAFTAILLFVIFYIIDIHYFYYAYNFWAYPILAALSLPWRLLFLLSCALFIFGAFLIGDGFNGIVHSVYRKLKRDKKKSSKKGN